MSTRTAGLSRLLLALSFSLAGLAAPALATDTFEPNNTLGSATPISAGSPMVSYISSSGDVDYYKFTVFSSQQVKVFLDVPAGVDYYMYLYSADGSHLQSSSGYGAGVDDVIDYSLIAGLYYVAVRSSSGSSGADAYVLTLTAPLVGDTYETNDSRGDAPQMALGSTVRSFIFTANDVDYYRIGVPSDRHLRVVLDVPDSADYVLVLYDASGWALASSSINGDGADEVVEATVRAGFIYYVSVAGSYSYSQDTPYALISSSGSFEDAFEPNNSRLSARRMAAGTIRAKAYTQTDQDWYRFQTTTTDVFSATLAVPPSAEMQLYLYDAGELLIASSTAYGAGTDQAVSRLLDAGTYYLKVTAPYDASIYEDYVLSVSGSIRPVTSVPGDFDGNGTADLAVYTPATGTWSVQHQFSTHYGGPGYVAVPGDYNGDRAADVAVYEPVTGKWYVRDQFVVTFGDRGDVPVPADYNGDGATDVAVYRPSTGVWYVRNQFAVQFGGSDYVPIPGDFNGDGAADIAVYRPSTGYWYVRNQLALWWGEPGDLPVPADYNGDGTTDVAVYRPTSGDWIVRSQFTVHHGSQNDLPVPRDYDGDGTADLAWFRPWYGGWHVYGSAETIFGTPADQPLPRGPLVRAVTAGDYDGDRMSDVAVYRPSTGQWFVRGKFGVQFGDTGDSPVPGDYDGDGALDVAVFRPSTDVWYVRNQFAALWGTSGDTPVPGDYDGDGTMEVAGFAAGTWRIRGRGDVAFGRAGDIPVPADYDGDGIMDLAVFRPSNGRWEVRGGGWLVFGQAGDILVPGDYNGDGMADRAVFRPSTGEWLVRGQATVVFGVAGDTPVPGDYNGDGVTDVAIYRPSTGTWYVRDQFTVQYGDAGDVPVVRIGGNQ